MTKISDDPKARDYARERIRNFMEDTSSLMTTSASIARRAGITAPDFTRWINYQTDSIGPGSLKKLAQALGISFDKLISPLGPEDYK